MYKIRFIYVGLLKVRISMCVTCPISKFNHICVMSANLVNSIWQIPLYEPLDIKSLKIRSYTHKFATCPCLFEFGTPVYVYASRTRENSVFCVS